MNNYLGIDIGGTNVAFGIVNEEGEIIYSNNLKTENFSSTVELATKIKEVIGSETKESYSQVGVGAPSVNVNSGNIEYAPNLTWGDIVPLKEDFSQVFNLPVTIINDANAAALAEKHYGEAAELENFASITLGTGVGLGTFLNGKLTYGTNGLAGELGHFVVRRAGRECNCGNLGCLETYAGANGIVLTAKEKLEFSSGGSALTALPPSNLTPLEIFNAARKDDPVSLEVVDAVCHDLGYALSSLINMLDVEHIFITGGIAQSGNILRRKIEKHLKSYVLPNLRSKITLKISSLNQSGAGILGAVAAIKEEEKVILS
ncbi:MAG: ROK family protein [Crocinitomicaceae bacterium]